MRKSYANVTREQVEKVFTAMVELIEAKGAKNKMVSTFDIAEHITGRKDARTRAYVEACLDQLIRSKHVRYFVNERRYIYFGITALGWSAWSQYQAVQQNKVACKYCGKLFTARGISRHESACKQRNNATQTA